MRITQDFLLRTANDHVSKRIKTERDLLAAYLVGSVLQDEPLLGGTTDIDIILIHAGEPKVKREMVRVNDEIHLDVVHHSESLYQQPRALRSDAWLGTAIQDHPTLLYDVRHWFEFTQASVGSQFYRADQIMARARSLMDSARTAWAEMNESRLSYVKKMRKYMAAIENAANAVASLEGPPLARRRFMAELPLCCASINASGLTTGLVNLLEMQDVSVESLSALLPEWEKTFRAAGGQEQTSPDLHPLRLEYYRSAIHAYLDDGQELAAAYPLFFTWAKAASYLLATSPEYICWFNILKEMGLGKEQLPDKMEALDAYLDHVEEVLEDWGNKAGA
ncbi:MAG: hypothetical protein C0391_04215 [Anaerolinea sp.]|nr:hypothetical protein [Anaerolinea sp.]